MKTTHQTIAVKVQFDHTAQMWRGELLDANDAKRPPLFTYQMPVAAAGQPSQPWDGQGKAESPFATLARKHFPHSFTGQTMTAGTHKEFEDGFLALVRGYLLDAASTFGCICVPTNHVTQIITANVIKGIAGRLRKQSDITLPYVDICLFCYWKPHRLDQMTESELARFVARFCLWPGHRITPAAVKKRRERLGLTSSRTSGPKPRML